MTRKVKIYGACAERITGRQKYDHNNRPPSCDLPPEFYKPKLKPCPVCGAEAENSSCNKSVFRCSDVHCLSYGPLGDTHGHKWNSIPRRSEVLHLLQLVDWLLSCVNTGSSEWYASFAALMTYANKLKKEIGE